MAKLGAQEIIDISTAANAATLGAGEAGTIFRDTLRACYICDIYLTRSQRALVEKHVDVPLVFKPVSAAVSDHPALMALRGITRQVYERAFKVSHTPLPALVVGAAAREMKLYDANPTIHFYLHNGEAKDYDRIILGVMTDMCGNLRRKTDRRDRRIRASGKELPNRILVRYSNLEHLIQDYCQIGDRPPRYHVRPIKSEMLIFEDSIYNFTAESLLKLFYDTEANYAVGYAMLPMELAYPQLPKNGLYYVVEDTPGMLTLNFHGGYSNGYTHKKAAWQTLMNSPVITDSCYDFSIVVEIVARLGPFAVFKLIRARNRERIVRPIALPNHMKYVRVLNIMGSINVKTGKKKDNLIYFSVFESEFYELMNYLLSIDIKSMTIETAMTFIRRRGGGASLVAQQLLAPWDLEKGDYYRMALTCWVYAQLVRDKTAMAVKSLDVTGIYDKLIKALKVATWPVTFWLWDLYDLYNWIFSENLTDKLVQSINTDRLQVAWTKDVDTPVDYQFGPVFPREDDDQLPNCAVCADLYGKLGDQKVLCECRETYVDLALTTEQLNIIANGLIDTDHDAPGIANVKKRAKDNMPTVGFKHRVRMHYVRGGPGCGKSYIVRLLADQRDLIYAPFTKLRSDYVNIQMPDGTTMDLNFKTTHRGMETRGCRRIFVDEYTSMPYEFLAMVAKLNGADEIFLVGDEEQTQVREPDEGMYMGNHIPLQDLDKHTLLVNFRNPGDTVYILNRNYGYNMESWRGQTVKFSIEVVREKDLPDIPMKLMGFSSASCALHEIERNTVRANQGGDFDTVALFLNTLDGDLLNNPHLARVALSRHKKKLYLVTDDSERADLFIASLGLDDIHLDELPVHDAGITQSNTTAPEVSAFLDSVAGQLESMIGDLQQDRQILVDEITDNASLRLVTTTVSSETSSVRDSDSVSLATSTMTNERDRFSTINELVNPITDIMMPTDEWLDKQIADYLIGKVDYKGKGKATDPGRPPPKLEFVVKERAVAETAQTYYDTAIEYVPTAFETVAVVDPLPLPEEVKPKPLQTGHNALELLSTLVSSAGQIDTVSSLNYTTSAVVQPGFTSGVVDSDFVTPVNMRGHPQDLTSYYHIFCGGIGLHYGAKKPFQTLQVLRDRYAGKKPKYEFTHNAELLADKIADEFISEHMQKDLFFDSQEIQMVVDEFFANAREKHYQEQFVGYDNFDVRVVRFHIKDIYKPKALGPSDVYKAGQGISAWAKDAQIMFGAVMRILNKRFKDALLPHAFYDNRETEDTARIAITSIFSLVPETAVIGVTDYAEFDSGQNKFTQRIEKRISRGLGASEEVLDMYYSFRSNYVLQSSHARVIAGEEKTSGEPGTLYNNSTCTGPLNNYLLRGDGPVAIAFKGDDGAKSQCNLHVDEARYCDIKQFVDLKLKISIGNSAEFCGNTICGNAIVPSIVRKVNKLASHRFRSYDHFTEYQKSLRDWVGKIQDDDYFTILAANSVLYEMPIDEVRACFEAIQSASHIDKETFDRYFIRMSEPMVIMTSEETVYIDA